MCKISISNLSKYKLTSEMMKVHPAQCSVHRALYVRALKEYNLQSNYPTRVEAQNTGEEGKVMQTYKRDKKENTLYTARRVHLEKCTHIHK